MTFLPVTMAILFFSLILIVSESSYQAYASHNPNLYVSAENLIFDNHFSGSMVVEVVVNDPNLLDTDEGKGEPDVSLNGKQLRMVQASDGKWYAYFANLQKAKIADQISFDGGVSGVGLDFGVFCSRDTTQSVFGASFSDTDGIAIPHDEGITGATNGQSSFTECTGSPTSSAILNNVIREPKSINTNSAVPPGQIGLDPDAWPVIQLFSFDDVVIQYNRAGGSQRVALNYDEIPNVLLNLDRTGYPKNAEVFVSVNDFQLNQDPTDEDSWTFNVASPQATFYQAFDENGANSANGGSGLVNLIPHLSNLGFEDNGKLTLGLGNVAELGTNNEQPSISVTDGTNTFTQIVTLVESEPNSGIFENFDFNDKSTITILANAPRGQSDVIEYNSVSTSIISGTFSASISIEKETQNNLAQEDTTKVSVIPRPVLSFITTEEYEASGNQYIQYRLTVDNWQSYPQYLFEKAPHLPPCGLNENAARTWVDIFNGQTDAYIYGYCGFASPDDLTKIWFSVAATSTPPQSVYVKLIDRQVVGGTYTSNIVTFAEPELVSSSKGIYGELKVEKENYEISYSGTTLVKLFGTVDDSSTRGSKITFTRTNPEGDREEFSVIPSKNGYFENHLPFDRNSLLGIYEVRAFTSEGSFIGKISFQIYDKNNPIVSTTTEPEPSPLPSSEELLSALSSVSDATKERVPSWIKNNAKWWSDGQIGDSDFVGGIQFMIKEKIINIPDLPEVTQMELKDEKRAMGLERDQNVPDWVRNNAGWWADGLITEDDFVGGIKWLVENGVIKV